MMDIQVHRSFIGRYGVGRWCIHCVYTAGERAVGLKALRGMTLRPEDLDPRFREGHPRYSCHRSPAREFAQIDGAAKLESELFYDAAAKRGDWCCYLSDEGTIASYGWYSTVPVPAVAGYSIEFSPSFVYMYNGFTLLEYRGQQLHAYGMAHALAGAVADGYQGLISYVEAHNAASLRSVARLGYQTFGTCFRIRILGKTVTFSSRGCEPYEFRLVPTKQGRDLAV